MIAVPPNFNLMWIKRIQLLATAFTLSSGRRRYWRVIINQDPPRWRIKIIELPAVTRPPKRGTNDEREQDGQRD
jgi:hypothetical protein